MEGLLMFYYCGSAFLNSSTSGDSGGYWCQNVPFIPLPKAAVYNSTLGIHFTWKLCALPRQLNLTTENKRCSVPLIIHLAATLELSFTPTFRHENNPFTYILMLSLEIYYDKQATTSTLLLTYTPHVLPSSTLTLQSSKRRIECTMPAQPASYKNTSTKGVCTYPAPQTDTKDWTAVWVKHSPLYWFSTRRCWSKTALLSTGRS